MDGSRFDGLTRSLGRSLPRRSAVGVLGALAALGVAGADAGKRRRGPSVAQGDKAAVVIKDGGCGLLDASGDYLFADSDHSVITSSGSGKLTCKAGNVPNDTGRAVFFNYENTGVPCSTHSCTTEDWQEVISASGQATLTCKCRRATEA